MTDIRYHTAVSISTPQPDWFTNLASYYMYFVFFFLSCLFAPILPLPSVFLFMIGWLRRSASLSARPALRYGPSLVLSHNAVSISVSISTPQPDLFTNLTGCFFYVLSFLFAPVLLFPLFPFFYFSLGGFDDLPRVLLGDHRFTGFVRGGRVGMDRCRSCDNATLNSR